MGLSSTAQPPWLAGWLPRWCGIGFIIFPLTAFVPWEHSVVVSGLVLLALGGVYVLVAERSIGGTALAGELGTPPPSSPVW